MSVRLIASGAGTRFATSQPTGAATKVAMNMASRRGVTITAASLSPASITIKHAAAIRNFIPGDISVNPIRLDS